MDTIIRIIIFGVVAGIFAGLMKAISLFVTWLFKKKEKPNDKE